MRRISGAVQHYAWGDREALPAILGQAPDGRPWAELWLGTHPAAPSNILGGGPLAAVAGELPYLLKVLAAAEPLSLQTHPTAEQARRGYDREQQAGIPRDSPVRIYRDQSAKPELLCALTNFDVLCGFRPPGDTEALLHAIGATDLAAELRQRGLDTLVHDLYRGVISLTTTVRACAASRRREAELTTELWRRYPHDPSVVVTLLLNRFTLEPGDAVHLGPGNLHAYVRGVGVEIMGASDNVVRGGLTSKHIDVDELLTIMQVVPLARPVVRPFEVAPGRWEYTTPGAPFSLLRLDVQSSMPYTSQGRELVLCTQGDSGELHHGECGYLAPDETLLLSGPSTVFVAGEA